MVDNEANRLDWEHMHEVMQLRFSDYNGDPEVEMHTYISSQERGLFCLSDAFYFRMLGDVEKCRAVVRYAEYVIIESMNRQRFYDYLNVSIMDDGELTDYRNNGAFNCKWYLRIAEIVSEAKMDSDLPVPQEIIDYFKSPRHPAHYVRSFFDNYACVWLAFDDYRGFVNIYESFFFAGSRWEKQRTRKVKKIFEFCKAMVEDDVEGAEKKISKYYEESRMWYVNTAAYPWWERLIWSYAWHKAVGRTNDVFLGLRGF